MRCDTTMLLQICLVMEHGTLLWWAMIIQQAHELPTIARGRTSIAFLWLAFATLGFYLRRDHIVAIIVDHTPFHSGVVCCEPYRTMQLVFGGIVYLIVYVVARGLEIWATLLAHGNDVVCSFASVSCNHSPLIANNTFVGVAAIIQIATIRRMLRMVRISPCKGKIDFQLVRETIIRTVVVHVVTVQVSADARNCQPYHATIEVSLRKSPAKELQKHTKSKPHS
mmetsp:Transcript_43111/g.91888  ORF Transcript_43111/g.91888 Transcript_43111/m.91888 type:complete len:224 (+) Transcript_43111:276-947(+)